jgi:hypothetical protein
MGMGRGRRRWKIWMIFEGMDGVYEYEGELRRRLWVGKW